MYSLRRRFLKKSPHDEYSLPSHLEDSGAGGDQESDDSDIDQKECEENDPELVIICSHPIRSKVW